MLLSIEGKEWKGSCFPVVPQNVSIFNLLARNFSQQSERLEKTYNRMSTRKPPMMPVRTNRATNKDVFVYFVVQLCFLCALTQVKEEMEDWFRIRSIKERDIRAHSSLIFPRQISQDQLINIDANFKVNALGDYGQDGMTNKGVSSRHMPCKYRILRLLLKKVEILSAYYN